MRHNARIHTQKAALVLCRNSPIPVCVLDLSLDGARVHSDSLKVGESVEFHWFPVEGLEPFKLKALVVRSNQNISALKFIDSSQLFKTVFNRLLFFHTERNLPPNSK